MNMVIKHDNAATLWKRTAWGVGVFLVALGYYLNNEQRLSTVIVREEQSEAKIGVILKKLGTNDKAHLLIFETMVNQYNEERKRIDPNYKPQPNPALEYLKQQVQEDYELVYPTRGVKNKPTN